MNNENGFSLVEVMLSLVLLAVFGTLFSSVFLNNIDFIEMSKNRTDAVKTAQTELNNAILQDETGATEDIALDFSDGSDVVSYTIPGEILSEEIDYPSAETVSSVDYFRVVY